MAVNTKNSIAKTYFDLIRRDGIDKVTVKDVAEASGVTRQTFYYHFDNLDQVIEWQIAKSMSRISEICSQQSSTRDAIRIILQQAFDYRVFINELILSGKDIEYRKLLRETLAKWMIENAERLGSDPNAPKTELEVNTRVDFASSGFFGSILLICQQENPDIDAVAGILDTMLRTLTIK